MEMSLLSKIIVAPTPDTDAYLGDFASWLASTGNSGHGRSEHSISAYVSDVRQFAAWFTQVTGQAFAPERITAMDLRTYYHQSADIEHCKASTWNRRRTSLALFCGWALQVGLIAFSPFQGVPSMETVDLAPKGLEKSDFYRFWRQVEQEVNTARTETARRLAIRNRAMIALMLFAGLRVSEVAELTPLDLLLSPKKGHVSVWNSKGNKSGDVPLGREARLAVSAWVEIHPENGSLFDGITPRQIERVVEDLSKASGTSITPHGLRHTFAYRFREAGGDTVELMLVMRHSRIDTTARYGKPRMEDLQNAVENL